MRCTVSPGDLGRLAQDEKDPVKAVLRNVAVIISTPKGSVPQYREFGLDMIWVDKPIPVARTMMAAPVREAVMRWEPRVTEVKVNPVEDPSQPGRLLPTVEVEINADEL